MCINKMKSELVVYRLYEKSDETTDLIGTDYYVIKDGENDFKGYKREDISEKIKKGKYDLIDWNFDDSLQPSTPLRGATKVEAKPDLEIENIQNVNYGFRYKENKNTINLNKLYFTDKINLIDKSVINDYDIECILNIIQNLMKNKDSNLNKYDSRLYNELMGECQYVENKNLKYLFLVYKK